MENPLYIFSKRPISQFKPDIPLYRRQSSNQLIYSPTHPGK